MSMRSLTLRGRVLRAEGSQQTLVTGPPRPSASLLLVLERIQSGKEKREPSRPTAVLACPLDVLLLQTAFEGPSLELMLGGQPTSYPLPTQPGTEGQGQGDPKATENTQPSLTPTCFSANGRQDSRVRWGGGVPQTLSYPRAGPGAPSAELGTQRASLGRPAMLRSFPAPHRVGG